MFKFFERLVDAYPETAPSRYPRTFFAFIWACSRGARGPLLAIVLLAAAIGAFEALLFAFMGQIVDWLAGIKPGELWQVHGTQLTWLATALAGSMLITLAWAFLRFNSINGNMPMRLRWNFHRRLLEQSMAFYQDEFAGRVSTKLMQTALAVRDVWMIASDILVYVLVYFATLIVVLMGFDALLLVPFLVWFGLYLLMMWFFVPRLSKIAQEQADARSLMTGRITDAYTNIATVKLFSYSRREAGFAHQAMDEFLGTVHAQMRYVTWVDQLNQLLSVLLIGSTMALALWLWSLGQIGVGAVAAASAMSLRLNGIAHWIMWEMATLFEHVGTVNDGMAMLSKPLAITDAPNAKPLVVQQGTVTFDNVCFAYGGERNVIDAFSLTIAPGEKIGLVGRSGAGKSTMVNLLLRFYDLRSGKILIDGQDIAQVTQDSLRAQVGMVTQDTSLLHRSVRENILYGRPDAIDDDMIAAAKRAQAHDFIQNLTDPKKRTGYDAHVGERGVKLSGGQRQRIAIARVMLKDAPILLLDEATSALDSEVEAAIQSSLYSLMEGKTVVAIAHRLSTIAAMDRLVVMDKGRIVETGDHQTLLAQGGLYARLWEHQSGGFLGEETEDAMEEKADKKPAEHKKTLTPHHQPAGQFAVEPQER